MHNRIIFLLLLLVLFFTEISAQQINNVNFTVSGKQIIVTYDITGASAGQSFNVQLFCSTDGGKSLGSPLQRVSGDAGTGIRGGSGKRIIWNVLEERNDLVGNVLFEVQAIASGATVKSGTTSAGRTSVTSDDYWVYIPGGTFTMGSPTSEPERSSNETQHQVTLSPFKMSKYEVTFEEYDAYCEANRIRKPDDEGWGRGRRPVINITYEQAKAFAESKGCRLPTEAEWEYACRAGSTTPFSTGENITSDQANYRADVPYNRNPRGKALGKTQEVGSYAPNAWGLYDMHGNVSEWVSDYYVAEYSTSPQTDPKGPASGRERIRRGGSWWDPGVRTRSAFRDGWDPNKLDRVLGIRLVSDI